MLDRSVLVTADLVVGLSEVACQNTQKYPWHYLVYAAGFVGVFAGATVPVPPPVMEVLPLALMSGWVRACFPEGLKRLGESFNGATLVEKYGDGYIVDLIGTAKPRLKTYDVFRNALGQAHGNMSDATRHFRVNTFR